MSVRLKLWGAFLWWLTAVSGGHAQANDHFRVLGDEHPPDTTVLPCRAGTEFEGIYEIRNVTVDDPSKFLYWVGGRHNTAWRRSLRRSSPVSPLPIS
jgi:hypothetical protein